MRASEEAGDEDEDEIVTTIRRMRSVNSGGGGRATYLDVSGRIWKNPEGFVRAGKEEPFSCISLYSSYLQEA